MSMFISYDQLVELAKMREKSRKSKNKTQKTNKGKHMATVPID